MKHILLLLGTIGANSFVQALSQNPNVIVFWLMIWDMAMQVVMAVLWYQHRILID